MSKNLIVLTTENISLLSGSISYEKSSAPTVAIPVYVVIVDDNSGSMSGERANNCVLKTKAIIHECVAKGVSYQYATFGSRNTQRGQIAEADVRLDCSEGTSLTLLAQAALDATALMTTSFPTDHHFRLLYVLNTDGEAHDGQAAADSFLAGYNALKGKFPNMIEARTFVLGIGANHDQKVLGAMSVGEASYFNYSDQDLPAMVTDSVSRIYPELTGSRKPLVVMLDQSGPMTVYEEDNIIDLSDMRVSRLDTTLTLPNGESYQLIQRVLTPQDPSYFDICLKGIEVDSLTVARSIKAIFEKKQKNLISTEEVANENQILTARTQELLQQLNAISDPTNEDVLITAALENSQLTSHDDFKTVRKARQQIYNSVRKQMKAIRSNVTDKKAATRAVLTLCETGLQSLRLGSLSVDIERDYMEVLGSGGFKHWTNKKKSRVTNRALEQADPDSISNVDTKVAGILTKHSNDAKPSEVMTRSEEDEEDEESEEEFYGKNASRCCWLTLMKDVDLNEDGDVLCFVGYVPPATRNLGLCSVSSSKVLHNAILNNKIEICPHPMSFLTFRQLALEGKSISRGPNGRPINVCVSFLPIGSSAQSRELAFAYTPICASQLLTSRWVYTVGTGEYRNGVLSALMSIVSAGVGEVQLKTLRTAIDGFCTTLTGSAFLNDLLTRAQNFSAGHSTSGEVPTFIVALGDQLALLWGYQHGFQVQGNPLDISSFSTCQFWRILFFRLLRDRMDSFFTAYCTPNDPDGDAKRRQKEIDAEELVEILVQGFHTTADPFRLQQQLQNPHLATWSSFFDKIGSYSVDKMHRNVLSLDSVHIMTTTLDDGVDLCSFFEEETLDNLSTFHDPNASSSSSSAATDDKDEGIPADAAPTSTAPAAAETLPIPSSLEDLIPSLLELKRKLPDRGSPATILTDEQILPSESSPIDPYRKLILLQIFKGLSRELQFILKCSLHFMFQLSEGQCPVEEITNSSLFDLLGIEQNEEGFLWLLSQIILAIKLRTNSRYRSDIEKLHTQQQAVPQAAAGGAAEEKKEEQEGGEDVNTGSVSLQSLSPLQLLTRCNGQYSKKQLQLYEEMQQLRRAQLRESYRRIYLTHPGNTSSEPLRIFSEEHLFKINQWLQKNRQPRSEEETQFEIVRTKCPVDNSFTSMANNTFLTPLSRYFLTPCSPYHVCSIIYGSGVQRVYSSYFEHLHTFTRGLIQQVTAATANEGPTAAFELYQRLFHEHYAIHSKEDNEQILVDLWISFSFDQVVEGRMTGYCDELYSQLESYVTDKDRLRSQITMEFLWHTNPGSYLDEYFSAAKFEKRVSMKPSLEEFLEAVAKTRSRLVEVGEVPEEDDLELASEVYAQEYQMDLEAGKAAIIE